MACVEFMGSHSALKLQYTNEQRPLLSNMIICNLRPCLFQYILRIFHWWMSTTNHSSSNWENISSYIVFKMKSAPYSQEKVFKNWKENSPHGECSHSSWPDFNITTDPLPFV